MKTGFTTTILHSDLESPIEHFSVHKPMHVAEAYGPCPQTLDTGCV